MVVSLDNIVTVIPQRHPFVMVDQLVSCDYIYSTTRFLIKAENVLVHNDELGEAGITENIAQTAAAGFGYMALQNNKPIAAGYIAAIKDLEIFELPKVGDTIETTVTITNQIFDVTIISGSVKLHGRLLASCEMKIFIK